jgi:hypothetical protein
MTASRVPRPHLGRPDGLARRRNKNLVAIALLPLLYLLALPHASEAGLAAGLLAPAGLEAFGHSLLAVGLLLARLLIIWVLPPAAAALVVSVALDRLTLATPSPRRTPRA